MKGNLFRGVKFHCGHCGRKFDSPSLVREHYRKNPRHKQNGLPTKPKEAASAPMRFCVSCGTRLGSTWVHCGYCGTRRAAL